MVRLFSIFGLAQVCFVFLGNALKSVVTSTVFTSEADFASFLNISVDQTGILIELLIGSAVLALAITPFILTPDRARKIATYMALLSVVSYGCLGAVMIIAPSLYVREIMVLTAFSVGGFCIAFFAPLAQMSINSLSSEKDRVFLTTIWTSAQPIAFLITPQLVKYVSHDVGTGNFFMGFAVLPIAFLLLSRWVLVIPENSEKELLKEPKKTFSRVTIATIFGFLLSFEAWTASISFRGLLDPISLTISGLFLISIFVVIGQFITRKKDKSHNLPPVALLLLLALFILEFPSTGFYDTAYLVRHLCASGLIEDRVSLGAAAQISTVFIAGAIYVRWLRSLSLLIIGGLGLLLAGTIGYSYYPDLSTNASFFYTSKILASAGMGALTTVVISYVMATCRANPIMALLPAFVIMFGTEFGLEILEIIFQFAELTGHDEVASYRLIFNAQIAFVLLSIPIIAWALWLERRNRCA